VPCQAEGNSVRSFLPAGIGSGKVTSTHPVVARSTLTAATVKKREKVMVGVYPKMSASTPTAKQYAPKPAKLLRFTNRIIHVQAAQPLAKAARVPAA